MVTKTFVESYLEGLFNKHGVTGWSVRFSRGKRTVGRTEYREKVVYISIELMTHGSLEEVEDVMRHEVAHVLTGPGHGHDSKWKVVARILGANPERCVSVTIPFTWKYVCKLCHREYGYHRKPKMTGTERCHCNGHVTLVQCS